VTNAAAKTIPRKVGIVAGFVALAALPALGLSAFAAADTGTAATSGQQGTRPSRPALTDTQKQCLADHGVTLPQHPSGIETGERPAPPTDAQRAAFHQAAAACGLPTPAVGADRPGLGGPGFAGPGGIRPRLTDAQKQCLADQGVTLPQRRSESEIGERPAPPTAEQRAARQQAAAACGITIPEHVPRGAGSAQGAAV
jgi:hypothetical protein